MKDFPINLLECVRIRSPRAFQCLESHVLTYSVSYRVFQAKTSLCAARSWTKVGVDCATLDLSRLRFDILPLNYWSLGRQRSNSKRVVRDREHSESQLQWARLRLQFCHTGLDA